MAGCGGGANSSTVSDKVWYDVSISIPMNFTNQRSCGYDADAFPDKCDDGTFITDHLTPVVINLTRVDPNTDPGSLFLEKYTVKYFPMTAGSPVIPMLTVYHTQELKEGSNTLNAVVVDVQRKSAFADLFYTGQQSTSILPVGYNAVFTFYGRNGYGQVWEYQASAPFFMGQYNECAPCILK